MRPGILILFGASAIMLGCKGEVIGFESENSGRGVQRVSPAPTCAWPRPAGDDLAPTPIGNCNTTPLANSEAVEGQPCTIGTAVNDGCHACVCDTLTQVWQCSPSICNPTGCPSRLPTSEALGCGPEACECDYPTACGTVDKAICVDGKFRIEPSACSPRCPADPPADGSPCWAALLRCDYEADGCKIRASCIGEYGYCDVEDAAAPAFHVNVSGRWVLMDGAIPAGVERCPATPPANHARCATGKPWVCMYGATCNSFLYAECYTGGGSWFVDDRGHPGACQPVCPSPRPSTGEPCYPPATSGPPCSYAEGEACLTQCLCAHDRVWACYDDCFDLYGPTRLYGPKLRETGIGYPAPPPGVIPPIWDRLPTPGGYCYEVGWTWQNCTCTIDGWQCQ